MAEPQANDPRPEGDYPEERRPGLMIGLFALAAIIVVVIVILLVRGMQEPGERQDVNEPGEPPTEQPEQDPAPSGPVAVSLELVESA